MVSAGYLACRSPLNVYRALQHAVKILDRCERTAAMLLLCMATIFGDEDMVRYLCRYSVCLVKINNVKVVINKKAHFFV